jgi:DNA-binding GntR family transcriptional regulator
MGLLSSRGGSVDEVRRLRQDLEIEYAFQRFGIEKDVAAFTLAGLLAPGIIQEWHCRPLGAEIARELSSIITFQERLDERIASLAGNYALLQQLWEITERTRAFRLEELLKPAVACQAVDEIVNLMDAMLTYRSEAASAVLAERLQRRCDLIGGQPPQARKVRLRVVS